MTKLKITIICAMMTFLLGASETVYGLEDQNNEDNEAGTAINLFNEIEPEPTNIDTAIPINIDPAIVDIDSDQLDELINLCIEEERKQEVIHSVIEEAKEHLGKPYVYGAKGVESFDCSLLMQYSLSTEGLEFPRTSREQRAVMKYIDFEDLKEGDFIFWHTGDIKDHSNVCHVAMYIGDGKMIQASPPQVKISPVPKYKVNKYLISYGRYDFKNTKNELSEF